MYKCLNCGKENTEKNMKRRVRCIYCGYKVLYKPRTVTKKIEAV